MSDTPYFTITEARTLPYLGGALANDTTFPDDLIDSMREAVEEAFEHACRVAFVPRTATNELHNGTGTTDLLVKWSNPTAVSGASVGVKGSRVALTADQLATIDVESTGVVYYPAGWPCGRNNVVVSYTHGYAVCPGRVKRAALLTTRRFLLDSPVNDRATSVQNPDGTSSFLVTAGVRGAILDIPEANSVIAEYEQSGLVG